MMMMMMMPPNPNLTVVFCSISSSLGDTNRGCWGLDETRLM